MPNDNNKPQPNINHFRNVAYKLLAYKCFSDYYSSVNFKKNSEPESFVENWLKKTIMHTPNNYKKRVWEEFLILLIAKNKE